MNEILTELFNQFSPGEQAEIREAEASAQAIEASGEAAVKERFRTGPSRDRDWILAPQDAARANAAAIEFKAYSTVRWRKTDVGSPESIREYLTYLDKLVQGVLRSYGQWESGRSIAELRRQSEQHAWLTHDRQSIVAWAGDTTSPQKIANHADGRGAPSDPEGHAEFWGKRQAEFEKYSVQFASVAAHWRAQFGKWVLVSEGGGELPSGCVDILDAIARKARPGIPNRTAAGNAAPWQLWLNFIRSTGLHCKPRGSPIAISKREWDRMVESGKPLDEVRTEFRGRESEEFEKSKKSGKTLEAVRRELSLSIGAQGVEVYKWLHDDQIEQVFSASADSCFIVGSGGEPSHVLPDHKQSDGALPQQPPDVVSGSSAGGQTKYKTKVYGGQIRYMCPHCETDNYDLAEMDKHVQWCPTARANKTVDHEKGADSPVPVVSQGPAQSPDTASTLPPRPAITLEVHESVAEIESRTTRLLERCRNVDNAIDILRTLVVQTFEKQAKYYGSLVGRQSSSDSDTRKWLKVEAAIPQWLDEIADETVRAALDVFDTLELDRQSRPRVEKDVRRTLAASVKDWQDTVAHWRADAASKTTEVPPNTSATEPGFALPTVTSAEPEALGRERRKVERSERLAAAIERWRPIAKRAVPFVWIHKAAGVDHKDAYNWKTGKLADISAMAESIERVLQKSNPPSAPVAK